MNKEVILDIMNNLTLYDYDFSIKSKYVEGHDEKAEIMGNEAIQGLLDLYNKEKEKNNKLTSLIYRLRNELRKLLISYDGEYYRPIKNTTKQEIYKSYFKLRTMLKGEYCFKDNETALKELLEDIEND